MSAKTNYRNVIRAMFDTKIEKLERDAQEYVSITARKNVDSAIERRNAVLAWLDGLIEKA